MINAKSQCTPMLNSHNLARSTMMLSINMKYVLLVMVKVTSITSIDIRTYTQEVIHFSFSQLFVSFVCDFLSLRSRSFFPFVSCIYYFLNMLRHCNAYVLFYVLVVGMYFSTSIPGNYQCVCYNFVSFISRISTASSCLISNVGCYRSYRRTTTTTTTTTEPPQTYKDELTAKSGLSTFGIIAIIFTIIVFALAFYYGVMCYPLLCRNDKKYRFMDVSSTITAATSRSIQSIENYPVDQKHHHQLA